MHSLRTPPLILVSVSSLLLFFLLEPIVLSWCRTALGRLSLDLNLLVLVRLQLVLDVGLLWGFWWLRHGEFLDLALGI